MEYVKYGDLQRYIELGMNFPGQQAPLITSQIASALQYMHSKGFIHRNLRPSVCHYCSSPLIQTISSTDRHVNSRYKNILVVTEGPEWSIKLADFGIATNVADPRPSTDYIRTSGFMPPEMVDSSQAYTAAIDVWALGAIVFCLLVGVPPFYKLDDMLGYCAGIRQFPTRILGCSSGYSIDFILRAMDPRPQQRMSIQQVLDHEWLHIIDYAVTLDPRYVRVDDNLTYLEIDLTTVTEPYLWSLYPSWTPFGDCQVRQS